MYDIAKAVGKAMVGLGLAKSEEPTTFTPEEIDKYFNGVCGSLTFLIFRFLHCFSGGDRVLL